MAGEAEVVGHIVPGRYRLVRLISEGVPALYEARHPRLVGPFSARLWPPTIFSEAFRRGAETAATLRHRGVVQVIDFHSETGEPPALITEWIEGARLSDLLRERGPLPFARAAALAESIAFALHAAHERGIVHQTLRPESIFVVQAAGGAREWAKVDDFGVAAALARAGVAPPSPYRAPEQMPGTEAPPDPRSDQFALAAIVYEMLTGARPFADGGDARADGPPPVSGLVAGADPAVDGVLSRALAPEPDNRFPDIVAFAHALGESAAHAPAPAPAGEDPAPPESPAPEPAAFEMRALDPNRPPGGEMVDWRDAFPEPRASRRPLLIAVGLGAAAVAVVATAIALRPSPAPKTAPAAPAPRATAELAPAPVAPPASAAEVPAPSPSADGAPAAGAVEAAPDVAPERVRVSRPLRRVRSGPHFATAAHRASKAMGAAPPAGVGACVISVASSPWADVWIDNHKIGHRTPLDGYHVGCGTHELILNRDDLGLFKRDVVTLQAGSPLKKSYTLSVTAP